MGEGKGAERNFSDGDNARLGFPMEGSDFLAGTEGRSTHPEVEREMVEMKGKRPGGIVQKKMLLQLKKAGAASQSLAYYSFLGQSPQLGDGQLPVTDHGGD